ncbi:MAG: site-specific integrase [Oligoflexia bacterium]|nr:site-specific integrase [Oligoflexia bacterium]MBF0366242.1 site-specific integrase [Oligoflexia bacterium]
MTVDLNSRGSFDLAKLQEDFFLSLVSASKSVNTVKNYRTDLNCFNQFLSLKKVDGICDLNDFNLTKVHEYASFLEEKYTSTNSRRRRVQTLRIFFDYLLGRNIIKENPVKKISPCPKFLDIPRPVLIDHIQTLWDHLLNESKNPSPFPALLSQRNLLIVMLIYGCGLKVSELSMLQKRHILLGKSSRVMVTPLRRDPYSIPLPEGFADLYNLFLKNLSKIVKEQKQIKAIRIGKALEAAQALSASDSSHEDLESEASLLLFNANHYRILSAGLSPRGLEIIFEELKKKLKIEITPKSLRQACIFKWLHAKHPESDIKEWLGVAPSYSFKPYLELADQYHYHDHFFAKLTYKDSSIS